MGSQTTESATVAPEQQPGNAHDEVAADSKHTSKKSSTGTSCRRRGRTAEGHSVCNVLHLLHRVVILAVAIWYLAICGRATLSKLNLVQDKHYPIVVSAPSVQYLMGTYICATTIRESPLVMLALQNDTSPRNGTLYLEAVGPSFTICTGISPLIVEVYSDVFLRSMYNSVVRDTKYNITSLAEEETELIAPVVNCLSMVVIHSFQPLGKFNFLVRKKHRPDDVVMVSLLLSNQEYHIETQNERGSTGIAAFSYISDLRTKSVEHYYAISLGYPYAELNFRVYQFLNVTEDNWWCLQNIPDIVSGEIRKLLITSQCSGFYMKSSTEQTNVNHSVIVISTTPIDDIVQWTTAAKAVIHNSWA